MGAAAGRAAVEAQHREPPRRVLLAGTREGADEAVARAGRRARDAGDEVVLVGSGLPVEVVAATALQEDVDAVLLVGPPGEAAPGPGAGGSASYDEGLVAALAALGADDVEVHLEAQVEGHHAGWAGERDETHASAAVRGVGGGPRRV